MGSRLSSLLVRDGLVNVRRMEKAFRRQVVHGGTLDTALLELEAVSEDRLGQYLALASGLPPAGATETGVFDAEAVKRCPEMIASKFGVAPLSFEAGTLRVAVHDPVDLAPLEQLADTLDLPIQPYIVPEYRWHIVFARAYNGAAPGRFAALAKQADASGRAQPEEPDTEVVAVKPLLVRPSAAMTAVAPPREAVSPAALSGPVLIETTPAPRTRTREISTPAFAAHLEAAEAQRKDLEKSRGAARDSSPPQNEERAKAPSSPPPQRQTLVATPAPVPIAEAVTAPVSAVVVEDPGHAPITVAQAREGLATAQDRDAVFTLLLRAMRKRAAWTGLLTIQGGAAIGRLALAEPSVDRSQISSVLIPLDVPSAFSTAVTSKRYHVGPIATGIADVDGMLARMGGSVPPSAFILPILLRERVVALAVAHRIKRGIGVADVTELLPLASIVGDELGRILLKAKTKHSGPVAVVDGPVTSRMAVAVPSGPSIETLVASLDGETSPSPDVLGQVLGHPAEALAAIGHRFPGQLRVTRYQTGPQRVRAAQFGGVLDLVVRFGDAARDLLAAKWDDADRDVRFYATVCAVEIRGSAMLPLLVARLFDPDAGVRALAVEGLAGYPRSEINEALIGVRRELKHGDPERVACAASAVAALGDVGGVHDLLEILPREAKLAEPARRALVALTKQDFGTNEKKWRKWWDDNRKRHRVEWLIDGLAHKEETIREASADDLRRLTGESFGYHHDHSRKERDAAITRWQQWWRQVGQQRFSE